MVTRKKKVAIGSILVGAVVIFVIFAPIVPGKFDHPDREHF
jgi:hypothetical protein